MLTIYVYLPEEAVDVWAPVNANHVIDNVYRIISNALADDKNVYEFGKGDLLRCRTQTLVEGIEPHDHLVAFDQAVMQGG